MEILSQFGIQPLLLLAQVVNFLILLYLLKRLLYKPILKMLDERREKIAQSLKNAEEIEKKLAQTEEDREEELKKALEEAKQIINEARDSATLIINEAHSKAEKDIEVLLKKSQDEISKEREKMHQEVREEIADLVVRSLQAVTGKVLTKKDQEEIISKNLKELK